MFEKALVAD